jgi:putative cardiolipin synthase
LLLLVCLVAMLAVGCRSLPSLDGRTPSTALGSAQARDTKLGRAQLEQARAHPGESGIYALADPHEAFAARVLLARAAERTLDVQYYIWQNDLTGTMLFDALRAAAQRNVRVRLLLDDHNTGGLDATLAALDAHPNIEVRLFNPFVVRSPRWIGLVTDFSRLNRRMHNKSFTADSAATIIGGRNIGDEYFGATDGLLFADLDVLAVGRVVQDVSQDFDRYWNSESSYPVGLILPQAQGNLLEKLASDAHVLEETPASEAYVKALRESKFMGELIEGRLTMEWAPTHMVSDDPAKGLGKVPPEQLLTYELERIIGKPESDVALISSYFVPTSAGVDSFVSLATRGVEIQILTNALETTDVPAVHAGYAKRRKPLLLAGIKLYEMKAPASDAPNTGASPPRGSGSFGSGSGGVLGSSGSSLHAKTFSVDGSRIFVGSFNFDPRSAKLNTELGFVIDSPAMARDIQRAFDDGIPAAAYEVHLSQSGDLYWTELRDGQLIRYDSEPGTGLWRRIVVALLSALPIEWLL